MSKEPAGFHSQAIEEEYKKLFKIALPSNWISLLSKSENFDVSTFEVSNKTTTTIRLKNLVTSDESFASTKHPASSSLSHINLQGMQRPFKSLDCRDASHLMKQVSDISLNPSADVSATTPSCLIPTKLSYPLKKQEKHSSVPKEINLVEQANFKSNGSSVIHPTRANTDTNAFRQDESNLNNKYSNSFLNESENGISNNSKVKKENGLRSLSDEKIKLTLNDNAIIGSGAEIPAPPRPDASGRDFDITVTHVNSPSSFWVQSYDSPGLMKLKEEMTDFYENANEYIPLNPLLVKPDIYFAAKYSGSWYRVVILSTNEDELDHSSLEDLTVNAFFIDTGLTATCDIENLQFLYSMFRSLPRQAFHASLSSILPAENDRWTDEAIIEFKARTLSKSFVSIIDTIQNDHQSKWHLDKPFVYLKSIIDTSTDDDVIVETEMVNLRHAMMKNQ